MTTTNRTRLLKALDGLPGLTDEAYRTTPAVKVFTPDANATWFLVEGDNDVYFGLCDLGIGFPELGYVGKDELLDITGSLGLQVELDDYWTGTLADGYEAIGESVPTWLKERAVTNA